jgi:hypothetical protein
VRAPNGLIEGNTFEHLSGCGVAIGNEPHWPEGPVPRNTIIRNNRFIGCGESAGYNGTAIQVVALKNDGYALGRPVAGIVIEGNTFLNSVGPSITLAATRGAVLRDNRIIANKDVLRRPGAAIEIKDSTGLTIDHTVVDDRRSQTIAAVDVACDVPAGKAGIILTDLKVNLAPRSVPVQDWRGK